LCAKIFSCTHKLAPYFNQHLSVLIKIWNRILLLPLPFLTPPSFSSPATLHGGHATITRGTPPRWSWGRGRRMCLGISWRWAAREGKRKVGFGRDWWVGGRRFISIPIPKFLVGKLWVRFTLFVKWL